MKYNFGDKLREVRERKRITMKEVAKAAGVSESLISQIERGRVSPAMDTLLNIAEVLDIDLDYLFRDLKRQKVVHVVKASERNTILWQGVTYEQLSSTADKSTLEGIEAYLLNVPIGMEKGNVEYGHPGKELGIILQGEAEFIIGNQSIKLETGDSLSFASDVPHILRNIGKQTLRAYWIVTPPKMFFSDEGKKE